MFTTEGSICKLGVQSCDVEKTSKNKQEQESDNDNKSENVMDH